MILTVHKIARIVDAEIIGNPDRDIFNVSSFDEATEKDITFASDPKFLKHLQTSNAAAIMVPNDFKIPSDNPYPSTLLVCPNPKFSFFQIVGLFCPEKSIEPGIHSSAVVSTSVKLGKKSSIGANAVISENVEIGENVHIMPGVFIGDDVILGDHTIIHPNVTILDKTRIGNHVIIHSGSVIGSDGFGFAQDSEQHKKLIHTGFVQILDHVEIGANCTIDRGTLGKTIIGNGVKIDNLVHLAHNVKIGDHTLIVAQAGIAGSSTIQKNVIIAGKAGISGHLNIGENAIVGPFCGVHSNVEANEIVSGIPQMPHTRWRKVVSIVSRLPEMRKRLFSFEKRLKDIENKL